MIPNLVNVIAWSTVAIASVLLARAHGPGQRAAWLLIAFYCLMVAIDKQVDVQVPVYNAVRHVYQALDNVLPMGTKNNVMRVATVGAAFLMGVLTTVVFIRRDKALTGPKLLALGGLMLIVAYVCLRWIPGIRGNLSERADVVAEVAGLLMISTGLIWDAMRIRARANL